MGPPPGRWDPPLPPPPLTLPGPAGPRGRPVRGGRPESLRALAGGSPSGGGTPRGEGLSAPAARSRERGETHRRQSRREGARAEAARPRKKMDEGRGWGGGPTWRGLPEAQVEAQVSPPEPVKLSWARMHGRARAGAAGAGALLRALPGGGGFRFFPGPPPEGIPCPPLAGGPIACPPLRGQAIP